MEKKWGEKEEQDNSEKRGTSKPSWPFTADFDLNALTYCYESKPGEGCLGPENFQES
jgi:hypothetical protein